MSRILLVDDEATILTVLSTLLKSEGYEVITALGGEQAKKKLDEENFDIVISDIRMSPVDGMQVLKYIHDNYPDTSVIMLTAYGSIETAIQAMKLGAYDYITKPFKVEELLLTVRRALEYRKAKSENADLKAQLEPRYQLENIIAESDSMKQVCEIIKRVAPTDTTILITGESGTGKELVARAIHACSKRKDKQFLAINCAALPETLLESELFGHVKGAFTGALNDKKGLLESANGGTVLLDEIGCMPVNIQAKLLRALQEKEIRPVGSNQIINIDVRILAASNSDLEKMMKEGKFREDLYYRISVIPIKLKPLRERKEDILPLAYHFIRIYAGEMGFPKDKLPVLDSKTAMVFEVYTWPGNIRELENVIRHALTFCNGDKILCEHLPEKFVEIANKTTDIKSGISEIEQYKCKSLKAFLRAKEKEYLKNVLESTGGDKGKAAKTLNISLSTLYRKMPEPE